MDYRRRFAEAKLNDLVRYFKVVLVTGARQVGKSTLVEQVLPAWRKIVFDPARDTYGARADPDLFLDNYPPPLFLDEIQYAPELLPALKRRVDESGEPGQYVLSGSQNLMALRTVAESMAGRVAILHMEGMGLAEVARSEETSSWLAGWLRDQEIPADDEAHPAMSLTRTLWRGSLPGLLDMPDHLTPDYLDAYIRTYLERDVRVMSDIRDLSDFSRFLGLTAALTAQEINDAQLGREIGVSSPTARRWREVLIHSHQWRELPPFHGNTLKRLSGKRKGHLQDTGLACSLQRLSSPDALPVSPLFGALFESWVVSAVFKQFVRMEVPPHVYHWRTANGAEVDIVLERDGKLYPVEVKTRATLSGHDLRGVRAFRETYGERVMPALVVYAGRETYRLTRDALAVPWHRL